MGPFHDPVTWYKITYTGEQVAQWDFQNKGRYVVLEVPLCNLLTSMCDFVPFDRVVQKAYYKTTVPGEVRTFAVIEIHRAKWMHVQNRMDLCAFRFHVT